MLICRPTDLNYSDVTPKSVYTNRRAFLRAMGFTGAAAAVAAAGWKLAIAPKEVVHATSKLSIA
jgi:hypothetical protein